MPSFDPDQPESSLTTADTFAMFASGFLLLPGVIAVVTGTSALLTYLASGLLAAVGVLSLLHNVIREDKGEKSDTTRSPYTPL